LRRRLGKPVYELPPSPSRRFFAGLQMCLTFFLLWPVFTPPGTAFAAALFSLPFLVGFARDWLAVSGVLHPIQMTFERLHQFTFRWLPVGLRALAAGLWLSPWTPGFNDYLISGQAATLSGLIVPGRWVTVLAIAEFTVILLLVMGLLGRGAAAAGLVLLGLHQAFASLTPSQYLLAGVYVALLYLGTGAYSLWQPEERLIYYRAGERSPIAGPPVEARPIPISSTGR
jgi:CDP-diacylglycerol--glycerol-3-phosphate 3-phosphatidyltransferase